MKKSDFQRESHKKPRRWLPKKGDLDSYIFKGEGGSWLWKKEGGGFFWGWGVENSMHTKNNTQTILKSMFEFMLIKWLRPMHGYGLSYIVEVHSWGIWFLCSCDN